jgi:hypothetical protein
VTIGNVLWNIVSRPVSIVLFGLVASRSHLDYGLLAQALTLLAAYKLCSLASMSLGFQLTRLIQCKSSFRRLEGRIGDFVVTKRADAIFSQFQELFSSKDRAKHQARAMYPGEDFGPNIVFVRPTNSNRKDRLLPPQAYPNFMEESLIIASIRDKDLKSDPPLRFLLCHEIEHCTPDAFRLEAEPYRMVALLIVTGCAFLVGARSDILGIIYCGFYLLLLVFEAKILIPAQLEARTDLRALARLNETDLKAITAIRDREYRQRLAERDGPFFHRWLRRGTLSVFIQSMILRTANALNTLKLPFDVASRRGRGFEQLGNRSLFGAALAFPLAALIYLVAATTSDVLWASAFSYLLAAPVLYMAGAAIGVEAQRYRDQRKDLLDRMTTD